MKVVSSGSILLAALVAVSASVVAADLPSCNSKQVVGMAIDSENAYFRKSPVAYGDLRTTDAVQPVELHADGASRYCVAGAKRNDNQPGEVGYVIEWVDRGRGQFMVNIKSAKSLRAQFNKPVAPPTPVAVSAPPPVQAPAPVAKKQFATAYDKCIDDSNGSMPDMIECAQIEAKDQDKRLNAAYKVAMAGTTDKDGLRSVQRQWIKTRDKKCAPDGSGGQNEQLVMADCVAMETAKRANELEKMK